MVMVLDNQAALTPDGNPLAPETPLLEMPVAPVVLCVIAVRTVLMQSVGVLEPAPAVLSAVTVIVPVAVMDPQPPVNGIE